MRRWLQQDRAALEQEKTSLSVQGVQGAGAGRDSDVEARERLEAVHMGSIPLLMLAAYLYDDFKHDDGNQCVSVLFMVFGQEIGFLGLNKW